MKKVIALLFAGALALGGALFTSASADEIANVDGLGSASTEADGYVLLLDGADDNPGVSKGFIGVGDDNTVQCSDEGDGYDYTYDEDGNVTSKTRADAGCHPENQLPS